ncbi:MAG: hypothetical protein CVV05_16800 [Gammaproteobacteria bacterium HGW-Gammaproteobacteria-1]|jgi:cell division protein FtsN|nr:MAG: hypothetical protein CVV05_16800 [Gammaproteobacteria bacterium HGW-Gammaproteobacteria-1]
MSDRQNADGQHEEEDLLADFRDVLGEDAGGGDAPAGDDTTDLDALDAFLNEFGSGDGVARDEVTAGTPVEDVAEFGADVPELGAEPDTDTSAPDQDDADTAAEAVDDALDVPELNVESAMTPDELNLDAMEEIPASGPAVALDSEVYASQDDIDDLFDVNTDPASMAPPPVYAAPAAVPIMAAEDEPAATGRSLDVSTIGVALLSLVIAAVAGWFALSLHGQMNDLRAELAQLRQQPAGVYAGPDRQTQETLAQLTQRVNEMALVLDGPMTHLSAASEQANAVVSRLDALEQRVGGLQDELAAAARSAPTPAPVKAAAKTPEKTAAPTPRPAAKAVAPTKAVAPAKAAGGWVVNVASLTDAKAASVEQARLKAAGFNVEVQTAQMNNRTWYRVRATGFSSREEAQVYSDMVNHKMGVTPWVGLDK